MNVERRFNLGGTAIAHQALISGGIDAYVEYSGTSLTAIFNRPPSTDSSAVYSEIRDRYAAVGVTALPRLGFNNTFAILVRAEDAERIGPQDDRRSQQVRRRESGIWLRVSRTPGRIYGIERRLWTAARPGSRGPWI